MARFIRSFQFYHNIFKLSTNLRSKQCYDIHRIKCQPVVIDISW